jgi:hypothetical protein
LLKQKPDPAGGRNPDGVWVIIEQKLVLSDCLFIHSPRSPNPPTDGGGELKHLQKYEKNGSE